MKTTDHQWTSVLAALILGTGITFAGDSFTENWAGPSSPNFTARVPSGAKVSFGIPEVAACDGNVLQLQLAACLWTGQSTGQSGRTGGAGCADQEDREPPGHGRHMILWASPNGLHEPAR